MAYSIEALEGQPLGWERQMHSAANHEVAALSEVERASNEQIYREFAGASSQSAAAAPAAAAAQGSSSSAGAATSSSGGVGPDGDSATRR